MDIKEYVATNYNGYELEKGEIIDEVKHIYLRPITFYSYCTHCGAKTECIHSNTPRSFQDIDEKENMIYVHINVRIFKCINTNCSTIRFSESLPFVGEKKKYSKRIIDKLLQYSKQSVRTISAKMKENYNIIIKKSLVAEILNETKALNSSNDVRVLKLDKQLLEKNINERIDYLVLTRPNCPDEILETIDEQYNLCQYIQECFESKTKHIDTYPNGLYILAGFSARLKGMFSNRSIPLALTSKVLTEKIRYNFLKTRSDGTYFSDGIFRDYIKKLTSEEITLSYNTLIRKMVEKESVDIYILDSTKVPVSIYDTSYENADCVKDENDNITKGYKIHCLYGLKGKSLLLQKTTVTSIKTHDYAEAENILKDLSYFKENDVLLIDRGYTGYNLLNRLISKKIYTIIPLKKNSVLFRDALIEIGVIVNDLLLDKENNEIRLSEKEIEEEKKKALSEKAEKIIWTNSKVKEEQKYTTVTELYLTENSSPNSSMIKVNVAIIRFPKSNTDVNDKNYYYEDANYRYTAIMTTNTDYKGEKIISYYSKRMMIEEQFRQLKMNWDLCNLRSHRYVFIVYQLLTTVVAYGLLQLFFQTVKGKVYANKSIKTINNKYDLKKGIKSTQTIIVSKGVYYQYTYTDVLEMIVNQTSDVQKEIIRLSKIETTEIK